MAAVKSDTRVELSFRGRFNFGIDQWAYVPFDVPTGIRRIDVSTSHDQFSLLGIGRNVLDLGIFGPAGHELGDPQPVGRARDLRGSGNNLRRVADRLDLDHIIDIVSLDLPGHAGKGHQIVGHHDDVIRIHRIRQCKSQRPARRLSM